MNETLKPTTASLFFYPAIAAWLASSMYQLISFYRLTFGAPLELALALAVLAALVVTMAIVFLRARRQKAWPLTHILAAGGSIIVAELLWRFWISRGPADFKLIGAVLDIGTPIIAALGIWAMISELRIRLGEPSAIQTPR